MAAFRGLLGFRPLDALFFIRNVQIISLTYRRTPRRTKWAIFCWRRSFQKFDLIRLAMFATSEVRKVTAAWTEGSLIAK